MGDAAREHKFTERILESTDNERLLEQKLQTAVQDVESAGLEQAILRNDLVHATAANSGLQRELETVRDAIGKPGSNSSLVEQRDAAVKAAMVLSDLLSRCSDRVVELGSGFDQAHARGERCQAQYQVVRGLINKAP